MRVGEQIRFRREEKGISAAELARRADISKGYLSEIENDTSEKGARISGEVLYRLATELGTTVADLLGKTVRPAGRSVPEALRLFAERACLPRADVQMLARIRFRGGQPSTPEDWQYLYESIKRSIRSG